MHIEQRLRRSAEFFGQVIVVFVLRDLGLLMDKYAKSVDKWLMDWGARRRLILPIRSVRAGYTARSAYIHGPGVFTRGVLNSAQRESPTWLSMDAL
jgi:hypothetical protein